MQLLYQQMSNIWTFLSGAKITFTITSLSMGCQCAESHFYCHSECRYTKCRGGKKSIKTSRFRSTSTSSNVASPSVRPSASPITDLSPPPNVPSATAAAAATPALHASVNDHAAESDGPGNDAETRPGNNHRQRRRRRAADVAHQASPVDGEAESRGEQQRRRKRFEAGWVRRGLLFQARPVAETVRTLSWTWIAKRRLNFVGGVVVIHADVLSDEKRR